MIIKIYHSTIHLMKCLSFTRECTIHFYTYLIEVCHGVVVFTIPLNIPLSPSLSSSLFHRKRAKTKLPKQLSRSLCVR